MVQILSSPRQIFLWFVYRWNIEFKFEDIRTHLNFEKQRKWSDRAIERTLNCTFRNFFNNRAHGFRVIKDQSDSVYELCLV
jgi:hypothetical protein